LKELLSSGDVRESTLSIIESSIPSDLLWKIVEVGITLTLESGSSGQQVMSSFFANLYRERLLSEVHFVKGFKAIFDILDDIEIDVPFAAKIVGKFVASAVADKLISISSLEKIPDKVRQPMMESLNGK